MAGAVERASRLWRGYVRHVAVMIASFLTLRVRN